MYFKVGILLFIESGSKSGAGLDDNSISSDDPVSCVGQGTAKSKFDVHVQIDLVIHILLNRTWCDTPDKARKEWVQN